MYFDYLLASFTLPLNAMSFVLNFLFVLPAHVILFYEFPLVTYVLKFEFFLCYVFVSPTRLTIKILNRMFNLYPLPLFHLLILSIDIFFFFFFFHIITLIILYKWLNWYLLLLLFGLKDYILVEICIYITSLKPLIIYMHFFY